MLMKLDSIQKSFDDYMSKLNHIARSKMKNIEAGISGTVLSVHAKSIYKKAWTWCCILATFSTFVWQLSNYYYGEDHTIVTYRKFNEIETDVYPSISLCWTMAISEKNLNAYGNILNREHYADFLAGFHWDENMLMVDYDNATLRFDDHVLQYGYKTSSDQDFILYDKRWDRKFKSGFKEHSIWGMRCLTFDIPFIKGHAINGVYVYFKSSIFGKGGRLANPDKHLLLRQNQFHLHVHYRYQIFRRSMMSQRNWPVRDHSSPKSYWMNIAVGSIDVLNRRNTYQYPCIDGIPEYDQKVIDYMLNSVKCKPPYWSAISSLGSCSQQNQLLQFFELINDAFRTGNEGPFHTVKPPCRSLERISTDVIDIELSEGYQKWIEDSNPWMNGSIKMFLDFKEWTYKEVKSVRGMDVQTLIGKYITEIFIDVNVTYFLG